MKIPRSLAIIAIAVGLAPLLARAFYLEGQSWTRNRTVHLQLSLGGARALSDGFQSFNDSALDALQSWNQYLAHVQLTGVVNSPVTPSETDDEMSVFFSGSMFGSKFGSGVLAVTLLNYRGPTMEETDTIFNNAYVWDSYRGTLRPGVMDFHRVATHEFGHTLGLDHPDDHGQHVTAIMNANISNIDTQQEDDIAGVQSIYNTGPAYQNAGNGPVMLNLSTRALVGSGDNVLIGGFIVQGSQPATLILRALGGSLRADGISDVLEDTTLTVMRADGTTVATSDDWFNPDGGANPSPTNPTATSIASYHLDPPNSIESAVYATLPPGSYTAVVQSFTNSTQAATTGVGLVEIYDLHTSSSRLGNLSTRGVVQSGNDILIGGFIVGQGSSKTVAVRALGPSLADRGVANSLGDPTLELHDASGNTIASNDDWQQGSSAAQLQSEGLAPVHPSESAIQVTVNPGNYTALVRSANGSTGVGLVEVYDLSAAPQ